MLGQKLTRFHHQGKLALKRLIWYSRLVTLDTSHWFSSSSQLNFFSKSMVHSCSSVTDCLSSYTLLDGVAYQDTATFPCGGQMETLLGVSSAKKHDKEKHGLTHLQCSNRFSVRHIQHMHVSHSEIVSLQCWRPTHIASDGTYMHHRPARNVRSWSSNKGYDLPLMLPVG